MAMNLMKGSEIFIKKLPSVRIVDIAKAINPKKKIKFVGKGIGEKFSEELISLEDSTHVKEFKDYFIINDKKESIKTNKQLFSYNSANNNNFLNIKDIKKIINLY